MENELNITDELRRYYFGTTYTVKVRPVEEDIFTHCKSCTELYAPAHGHRLDYDRHTFSIRASKSCRESAIKIHQNYVLKLGKYALAEGNDIEFGRLLVDNATNIVMQTRLFNLLNDAFCVCFNPQSYEDYSFESRAVLYKDYYTFCSRRVGYIDLGKSFDVDDNSACHEIITRLWRDFESRFPQGFQG